MRTAGLIPPAAPLVSVTESEFIAMRACQGLALALLVFLIGGCTSSGGVTEAPPIHSSVAVKEYLIGVDDMVQVTVWKNPELGITAPVRPDGKISVPLIGDVVAGGKAPDVVADEIQKRLSVFVRDPQVAVILTDLRSHEYLSRVRVTGAVRQPISIPYRQGMTVLDAVLAAGGLTNFAASDRAELFRQNGEGTTTYKVSLDRILNHGDLSTNFAVAPGDVITVPERLL